MGVAKGDRTPGRSEVVRSCRYVGRLSTGSGRDGREGRKTNGGPLLVSNHVGTGGRDVFVYRHRGISTEWWGWGVLVQSWSRHLSRTKVTRWLRFDP